MWYSALALWRRSVLLEMGWRGLARGCVVFLLFSVAACHASVVKPADGSVVSAPLQAEVTWGSGHGDARIWLRHPDGSRESITARMEVTASGARSRADMPLCLAPHSDRYELEAQFTLNAAVGLYTRTVSSQFFVGSASAPCSSTGCPDGQSYCAGTGCTDTRYDPMNCGECGNECSSKLCGDGLCRQPCGDMSHLESLYAAWRARIASNRHVSSLDSLTDDPGFEAIVNEGRCALPFVFEKIGLGDVAMGDAALMITGVDVWSPVRSAWRGSASSMGAFYGGQDTSVLWVDWWSQNKASVEWQLYGR